MFTNFANAIRLEVKFAEFCVSELADGVSDEQTLRRLFGRQWDAEEHVLADYPAYTIVEPKHRKVWTDDEEFALPFQTRRYGTQWHFFQLGSVVSYALRNRECPIEAVDRTRRLMKEMPNHGHKLHWAIPLPVVLSARPAAKRTVVGLNWGDRIKFEGRTFELKRAPNDNVSLVEVEPGRPEYHL